MNIPHEWHDDAAGDAGQTSLPMPPLVGTPYDAAGRILLALNGLGLTVQGVAVTENEWVDTLHYVHVVTAPRLFTKPLADAIDAAMCDNADVRGRWWVEQDAVTDVLTRLGFEVG